MKIDEAIEIINHYLDYPKEEVRKALLLAIDTMRKYQKIKEIVTNNELEWGNTSVRANALWEIKKVVENGKID